MDQQTTPQQANKTILIIEDEHFITELYTRALTKAGYEVTNIIDGSQALAEASTDKYDIILLDIMVPNVTGIDILHSLREKQPNLHSKIIIATNLDQGEETRKVVEQQADGYLIKAEITPRQLVEFLQKLS